MFYELDDNFVDYLQTLSPSGIDLALSQLSNRQNYIEHLCFIDSMTKELLLGKRFELVQAWFNRYLALHSILINENYKIFEEKLRNHKEIHNKVWQNIRNLFNESFGILSFMQSI